MSEKPSKSSHSEIPGMISKIRNAGSRVVRCEAHKKGTIFNPVSFEEVSFGSTEVFIEFQDQLYRLSRTRSGKLILTKATTDSSDP